jgi:hypothetical protein
VFVLKYLNDVSFISLAVFVLIVINTGGNLRYNMLKNICVDISVMNF